MHSLFSYILIAACLISLPKNTVLGQTPAHFFLGEKELENIEIYSILESKNERLYIATNNGVYIFRNGRFERINSSLQVANRSIFGLVQNSDGAIYCHNLGGQIFKLSESDISLYCAIPEKYITNRIRLFCSEGDLYYFSKGSCLRIDKQNSFTQVSDNDSNTVLGWELSVLSNGRILISTEEKGEFLEIKGGKAIQKSYTSTVGDPIQMLARSFFMLNDSLIIEAKGHMFEAYGKSELELTDDYNNRFYNTSNNEVWGLRTSTGITAFKQTNGVLKSSKTHFENYFISAFNRSRNGTIYLGTFGNGIIVIPNTDMIAYPVGDGFKKIRDLAVTKSNTLFYTEMGKGIMMYDGTVKTIQAEENHFFYKVFWEENFDFGVNEEFKELNYQIQKPTANVIRIPTTNDVFPINERTVLFGTAKGLLKKGPGDFMSELNWDKFEFSDIVSSIRLARSRTQAVTADTSKEIIYFSDLNGTYSLSSKGLKRELLFESKKLKCEDLLFHDQFLWCATLDYGVLVFKGQTFIKQYRFNNEAVPDRIRQIAIRDNQLFVLSDNLVKCKDLVSGKVREIGIAEGSVGSVNKFDLSADRLWLLVDNSKILSCDLESLAQKKPNIHVFLDSIVVVNNPINIDETNSFSYDQNEFMFYVDFRNPALGDEASIKYRIAGFETEWNTKTVGQGEIEYKYLPPGQYTFEVFTDYHGTRSEIKSYAFSVAQPYWFTTWFIVLVGLSIVLIFALILRYRVKILKRREREEMIKKELKSNFAEAELRALRSQMNPHFIFNSLHSIQALILNSEIESSYDYLVLFSKLVRNVLSYSNEEFIPIESELEFLEIYLKLEKLRFEDDFNFTIELEGENEILVPSLIVQPFVENALIHGLHHKTEDKLLSIQFRVEDDFLKCTIEDNGIGRKAAQEIKDRQGDRHESFAIQAIQKRLNMYQSQMGGDLGFTIVDLHESGTAIGTRVELILPYKTLF